MKLLKRSRLYCLIAGLALVYFVSGKAGLSLAFVNPSATAVWPPTGIAIAALLLFGYRLWPGVLLGAFLVNMTTAGSLPVCIGIAVGNTLEALAAARLSKVHANGRNFTNRTRDILKFVFVAGVASPIISATIGVTSLVVGGYAPRAASPQIWTTWWLGDATGAVVIAPLILLWVSNHRVHWEWRRLLEAAALLGCLLLIGAIVFGGVLLEGTRKYPLEYLCIPFLLWAGFRFGTRAAATATLLLAATAVWGTFHNLGPFAVGTPTESFFLLQMFIGVVAIMSLSLAAIFAERQSAEAHARILAVSDPLTGLGNYRKLIDTLESEIRRSDRTGRPFAFLVMDLDQLKKINDEYGHQTGDKALRRLASVLRNHCRSIDTAVRQGGDEFALIIPEADATAAAHVARRITERLKLDAGTPALSVSIGASVWPDDGHTIEQLLRVADQQLYKNKRRHHIPPIEVLAQHHVV